MRALASLLLLAATASAEPYEEVASYRYTHLEFVLDFGPIGWTFGETKSAYTLAGRLGVGGLHRQDDWVFALFAAWEPRAWSDFDCIDDSFTPNGRIFGAHAWVVSTTGFGLQGGGLLDLDGHWGVASTFVVLMTGAEVQYHSNLADHGEAWTILIKATVPIVEFASPSGNMLW